MILVKNLQFSNEPVGAAYNMQDFSSSYMSNIFAGLAHFYALGTIDKSTVRWVPEVQHIGSTYQSF